MSPETMELIAAKLIVRFSKLLCEKAHPSHGEKLGY